MYKKVLVKQFLNKTFSKTYPEQQKLEIIKTFRTVVIIVERFKIIWFEIMIDIHKPNSFYRKLQIKIIILVS